MKARNSRLEKLKVERRKIMLRKLNLLLAILTTLVFSNSSPAQLVRSEPKNPVGFDLMLRVPEGCPKEAKLETIARNQKTGTKPSAVLTQWMKQVFNNPQFPTRGYAVKGPDSAFYDSFAIGGCRVCAAKITAQVSNEGGHNDAFNVILSPAAAPITSANFLVSLVSYGTNNAVAPYGLWSSPTEMSKTLSIVLNANSINKYIVSGIQNPSLDVYTQDDTRVESMQLEIWRY
jgi:hypothetical protein